jgi:Co/Zn/Cd efflux system component
MKDCCEARPVQAHQRRVLRVILLINAAMFLLELGAALVAESTALLSDSADMLGDTIVYGFSLYVVGRGAAWQARAALAKGIIMAAVGVLALLANVSVLALLWRYRTDDVNMRSVWLCSRNDVMANAGVLAAAVGVAMTGSAWPDIAVGVAIAGLFMTSALGVITTVLRRPAPAR